MVYSDVVLESLSRIGRTEWPLARDASAILSNILDSKANIIDGDEAVLSVIDDV